MLNKDEEMCFLKLGKDSEIELCRSPDGNS